MEELPVAAGRSVATGAMRVNLLPCHFFCLPLPTLLRDKLLLAVDLLVVKSAPCAGMKVG